MNTILILVAATLAIIAVACLSGKGKSQVEKSSTEKIASTIKNKVDRKLKEVAEGVRDLETVKEEILDELDEAKKALRNDYKTYLTGMITARETYEGAIRMTDQNIPTLKSKAKTYKSKFEQDGDVKDREFSYKYISQLLSMEKIRDDAKEKLEKINEDIEDAKAIYDLESMKLEDKKLEILTTTCAPNISVTLSTLNLNDLTQEFKEKLNKKNIETEVQTRMSEADNAQTIITTAEMDEAFNGL